MATKDIKDFTKYPSLSDDDYLLGTKTSMGGTDAGILVGALRKQVAADAAPVIKNGYWWSNGVNTGLLATGKTPVFRKTAKGLEYKYEGEDDAAYVLLIPMADLSFTFADLTPDQVLQLKLKFSDLTEADKLALRGKDFTYDMFTPAQLDALRLTYDKLTPAQKAEIKGERGYSAYEVYTQQPGNTGKTYAQYEAELQKPATDAAKRLNALSDHRDEIRNGYWWRWDEVTDTWRNTGEIAKGNVMYATFDVDLSTMELSMLAGDEYTGANFELDEKGYLSVIIQ